MICEFVTYGDGIYKRLLCPFAVPFSLSLAAVYFSTGEHFYLLDQVLHLIHTLDSALYRMILLGEPFRNVRLASHEPRIYEDVVVYATPTFDCGGGSGHLEEPGRVGVEVMEQRSARSEGADYGGAYIEV